MVKLLDYPYGRKCSVVTKCLVFMVNYKLTHIVFGVQKSVQMYKKTKFKNTSQLTVHLHMPVSTQNHSPNRIYRTMFKYLIWMYTLLSMIAVGLSVSRQKLLIIPKWMCQGVPY